jgi:hypothetical protein
MGHQDHSDHSQLPLMKTVSQENEIVETGEPKQTCIAAHQFTNANVAPTFAAFRAPFCALRRNWQAKTSYPR